MVGYNISLRSHCMLSAVSAVALGLAVATAGSGFPVSAQKTPQTAPPTAAVKAVTGAKTVFVVRALKS
jgi:hypothetical protein